MLAHSLAGVKREQGHGACWAADDLAAHDGSCLIPDQISESCYLGFLAFCLTHGPDPLFWSWFLNFIHFVTERKAKGAFPGFS